jgi:hypothetical protein
LPESDCKFLESGMERLRKQNIRIIWIVGAAILILMFHNVTARGQYNENLIKAAYIERMIRFVDWPVKNSELTGKRFVIGVYGDPAFYKTLSQVFSDKLIKDLVVKINIVNSPDQLNTCNLCYLSEKAKPIIKEFVSGATSFGVLLISEADDFGKDGVHVNFYIEDEKLKFEINEKSILSAGFKVSYLLMQNSRVIQ